MAERIIRYTEEVLYVTKMDQISAELEEMILDAMIAALKKIKERNLDAFVKSQKLGNVT